MDVHKNAPLTPAGREIMVGRVSALEPAEPVARYERQHPGEMIRLDIKKLGRFDWVDRRITGNRTGQSNSRGTGCEFVHVCLAPSRIMPDERKESAIAFLSAALAHCKSLGVMGAR